MNKQLSPTAVAGAVCLAAALLAGCATQRPGIAEINLVTLNDFHGNLEASKFTYTSAAAPGEKSLSAGGIDALGATLQAWRRDDPQLLLVGAGDLIGASPSMSAMWADEPTIGAMNLLGLRASSVGNHEFDQGRIELLRQQKGGCASPRADKACKFEPVYPGAHFTYLAANVIDMVTRKPFMPAYKIEEAHGVKIGFIGAVLKDTASVARASGIAGLEFTDEADAINRQLPALRQQGVGVFVVLIHQGGKTVEPFDKPDCSQLQGSIVDIVKRLDPAIRVIVSGHSHKGYLCKVDGRLVTQSDMGGHVLGRIKLTVDTASNAVRDVSASNEIVVPGRYPENTLMSGYLDKVRASSAAVLARPVAKLAVPTVTRKKGAGDDHDGDGDESALGDLVADSVLAAAQPFGAQVAFMNNGGIRQDLNTGPDLVVSTGQAQMVLPFGNALTVMDLTGAQVTALLEQQWNGDKSTTRGLLQPSQGFSYTWNPAQPEGRRVVPGSVLLNGVPLVPGSTYRVAVNNFLAEGGDAFPMLIEGRNRVDTGIRDIDALTAWLVKRDQAGKPAGTDKPLGRIRRTAPIP